MSILFYKRRQLVRKLKSYVREWFPANLWSEASVLVRGLSRLLAVSIAFVIVLIYKCLPDRCLIALRQKLILRRPLDYDRGILTILTDSATEYNVRLQSCQKEPETVHWIQQTIQPGDVLYDIGSNIGAYALIAAHASDRQALIYAFEPGYNTFPHLVDNIMYNGYDEIITPFQIAFGACTAPSTFGYSTSDAGGAQHKGIQSGNHESQFQHSVLTFSLDDFIRLFKLPQPTHLKIDVDGSEMDILHGMTKTLTASPPRWLLIEIDTQEQNMDVLKTFMQTYDYVLYQDFPHVPSTVHNVIFKMSNEARAPRKIQIG